MSSATVWLRTNTDLSVSITSNTKEWTKHLLRGVIGSFFKRPFWGEFVKVSTSLEVEEEEEDGYTGTVSFDIGYKIRKGRADTLAKRLRKQGCQVKVRVGRA